MSARSAYNLRDRDPLFAAGWDAASVLARPRLADEAWSRAMNGVVERIYRDGVIVAERHKYDNRLTMSVLARLDARIDRAEERGAAHLRLTRRWDDYLAALAEDRVEDGLALLAPPAPAAAREVRGNAGGRELHELHPAAGASAEAGGEAEDHDPHTIWEGEGGWWTDYPPPSDFDGEEEGTYGDDCYCRTLSEAEQAVVDADVAEEAEEKAEAASAERALAEAQRDAWFGFAVPAAEPAPFASIEPDLEVPRPEGPEPEAARPEACASPPPPETAEDRSAAGTHTPGLAEPPATPVPPPLPLSPAGGTG